MEPLTQLDPGIVERYAAHLARRASARVMGYTIVFALVGSMLGSVPLIAPNRVLIPHSLGLALLLIGAAAGGYLGYTMGVRRAEGLKLQAQVTLHQLQVEMMLIQPTGAGAPRLEQLLEHAPPAVAAAPAPVAPLPPAAAPAPVAPAPLPPPAPVPAAPPPPLPAAASVVAPPAPAPPAAPPAVAPAAAPPVAMPPLSAPATAPAPEQDPVAPPLAVAPPLPSVPRLVEAPPESPPAMMPPISAQR